MALPQPERLRGELRPLVERAVSSVGFDLEDIEVRQAGRRRLVRVVVDADSGVGLDDIAVLSRRIAAELDQHDAVLGGPYTLEVTSPGVDRPLTLPRHWRRSKLRLVEVALNDAAGFTGRVGPAGDDTVLMLVDGRLRELRYVDVKRASVVVEFRHPPEYELRALAEAEEAKADRDDLGEVAEEHK